jgi:hypothetical protein
VKNFRTVELAFPAWPLKGVTTTRVVVEDLKPQFVEIGLDESAVRKDVELRLRTAGLKVVDLDEPSFLYINLNLTKDLAAAEIDVEFQEPVYLARNFERVLAATWGKGGTITCPDAQFIRDRLKDLVDQFLDEWLKQNPKP